ncbi:hypothetical protein ACFSCZ_09750 [Siminovitchia sediminis]|uniref:Uncharacterized protein n=1 Tax=Siminovitchia sediminis TaxID=1274353 RepID=A0ABW4KH31_9BACI
MWIAVIPVGIAIRTMGVVIAEYTPVFKYLGWPFIPILTALHVPKQPLPLQPFDHRMCGYVFAGDDRQWIESEMTRFVIGCVSVTRLFYLSEVGGLLLGSKIPVNMKDLLA